MVGFYSSLVFTSRSFCGLYLIQAESLYNRRFFCLELLCQGLEIDSVVRHSIKWKGFVRTVQMRFPLPVGQFQAIPLGDISGSPALAAGIDRNLFFAICYTGFVGQAQLATLPKIAVANWRGEGIVNIATPTYPGSPVLPLTTELGDTQPSVCAGPNNEMYLAFTTQGSLPLKYNMDSTPSFCECPSPGTSDVCVAAIAYPPSFGLGTADIRVNWWLQDASLNSCNNESNPQLCCDRNNRFLYMVHESSANILCFPVIGTGPNVVLSCLSIVVPNITDTPSLSMTGNVVYREAQTGINCAGATTNPAIATDQNGGVYVAVEINAPVLGGATPTATRVIEVIKFQNASVTPYNTELYNSISANIPPGIFTSMSRSYVLSGLQPSIFPPTGTCSKPSIACDPVGGRVILAFTTTGTMPGQTQSISLESGGSDVVVVLFTANGTLLQVLQGDVWSPAFNPYLTARDVSVTSDDAGNFFLSYVIKTASNTESVLAYKLYPSSGEQIWQYYNPTGMDPTDYTAYAYAMTGAPNAIFPTAPMGSYSKTPMTIALNELYMANASTQAPVGGIPPSTTGVAVTAFTNALYTFDTSVFNYIDKSKSICACGRTNCGCN